MNEIQYLMELQQCHIILQKLCFMLSKFAKAIAKLSMRKCFESK